MNNFRVKCCILIIMYIVLVFIYFFKYTTCTPVIGEGWLLYTWPIFWKGCFNKIRTRFLGVHIFID